MNNFSPLPVSAAALSDFDADVVDVRGSIVVELHLDLSDADAAIDGEALTPPRTRLLLGNDGFAQAHRTKAVVVDIEMNVVVNIEMNVFVDIEMNVVVDIEMNVVVDIEMNVVVDILDERCCGY